MRFHQSLQFQRSEPIARRKEDLKPRCAWNNCREAAKEGSEYCRWHQNKCPDCGKVIHSVSKYCGSCAQKHKKRTGQSVSKNARQARKLTPRLEIIEMIEDYTEAVNKNPTSENVPYFNSRITALTNDLRNYTA